MIRNFSPKLLSLLLLSCAAFVLTGCLSHWFTDSTTRLQIENKTSRVFLGLDIVSEDGSSVIHWIQDSLPPGERSLVYESDWVGTFNVRLNFASSRLIATSCESDTKALLAKSSEVVALPDKEYELCISPATDTLDFSGEFEFVGGSVFLVLSDNKDGSVHMETR